MKEKIYVVKGWDGDEEFFHNEKNAMDELNRRVMLVDECELIVEEERYLEYRHYDEFLEEYFYLTYMESEFSD